jgi:serine/threonine protein kinase
MPSSLVIRMRMAASVAEPASAVKAPMPAAQTIGFFAFPTGRPTVRAEASMSGKMLQPDLLFCRQCRRHFRGRRRVCPTDGATLELVTGVNGHTGDVLDDRYELRGQLGSGGMGSVFRAWDRLTSREVALKLLHAEYASNATSAQRFLNEARLVRAVQHPSVVSLHRFGRTDDGTLLIDMELVDGEAARDRVMRLGRGLEPTLALQVLDNLLSALAACHDAGVVHCDVKPENILLPRAGTVGQCKLVDFGIAQAPGPIVQTDEIGVIGTPAYMSPEQVRGHDVDARTDLYLVGCVAYELLTGEPPFLGANALDLCHHQLLTPPPPLADRLKSHEIPAGFQEWVTPLLAKDPRQRPSSARHVREQLRTIRLQHRQRLVDGRTAAQRTPLRPPSVHLLRRQKTPPRTPALTGAAAWAMDGVRAVVEIRQPQPGGVIYGPQAVEHIARHVLAATIDELRRGGAEVHGPKGSHVEVRVACQDDPRGAVQHLLDMVAAMNAQLARIPEPRLEVRAAVVADRPHGPEAFSSEGLDPLRLLEVSPGTQVRVDEHVARWAGRRPLVRLTSVPNAYRLAPTDIYATSLLPV